MQVEKFKNYTPLIEAVDKIWLSEFEKQKIELNNFFRVILESQYFADIVFNSNLFEFSNDFDKEFFNNISLLLSSYKNIGSYEAIINICRAILGSDTIVEFSNNGKDIMIVAASVVSGFMITTNNDNMITTNSDNIVSVNNRLQAQRDQLVDLLYRFLPAGIKYNISFGLPLVKIVKSKKRNKNIGIV